MHSMMCEGVILLSECLSFSNMSASASHSWPGVKNRRQCPPLSLSLSSLLDISPENGIKHESSPQDLMTRKGSLLDTYTFRTMNFYQMTRLALMMTRGLYELCRLKHCANGLCEFRFPPLFYNDIDMA